MFNEEQMTLEGTRHKEYLGFFRRLRDSLLVGTRHSLSREPGTASRGNQARPLGSRASTGRFSLKLSGASTSRSHTRK